MHKIITVTGTIITLQNILTVQISIKLFKIQEQNTNILAYVLRWHYI